MGRVWSQGGWGGLELGWVGRVGARVGGAGMELGWVEQVGASGSWLHRWMFVVSSMINVIPKLPLIPKNVT